MRKEKIFWLFLTSFLLLPWISSAQTNTSEIASTDVLLMEEDLLAPTEISDAMSIGSREIHQTVAGSFQMNLDETFHGGGRILQPYSVFSVASNSASFSRHLMCRGFDSAWDPIDPTTIFRPSDTKAVCLTTISVDVDIEFRWHYRSNSSKTWVSAYNWSHSFPQPGEYNFEGHLLIAGFWPACNYPRAYKVDVHLDSSLSPSFSEFFEVTNGGLNSPRVGKGVDAEGRATNMKSRFTIGFDTEVYHSLRFDKIACFNEELGYCHNFTTIWIQPNGTTYKTYSGNFTDYKDTNAAWDCWEYNFTRHDYISIDTSTPVGNWTVEAYLDSFYVNSTWQRYGPIATTQFIVGNDTVADWTFMVYLDADNNLEEAGIDIFEKMASVGSSSQVNIVVQMDRIPGFDGRYGSWTDCKRFNVTEGMIPTAGNATLPLGERNMGDPTTLKDFVNWTISEYPASYYCLVLWDHGAGFMGLCFDNSTSPSIDFLSLSELRQALSGLPVIMDVVLLDTCSMSMTEIAYQIKDYANILVGPEGLGYSPAPYEEYLSGLTSNSSMLPDAFAEEVVNDYIKWCENMPTGDIPDATMSATDLTKISGLIAAVDDFALRLKERETPYLSKLLETHEQIILARNQTVGYPGPYAGQIGYYVDLYHFAQLINQSVFDEELQNCADQLLTALNGIVIVEAHKAHPYSHGLSIFFPDEKGKYEDYETEYEETIFVRDTLWDEFLEYHLSGYVLTIETPYTDIQVEIVGQSNATDAYGEIRVFVLPGSYTINVTSLIYNVTGLGSRGVFARWSDNNMSNPRILLVNTTLTLKAEYVTQYFLTLNTSFGTVNLSSGWHDVRSALHISASAPSAAMGEQYVWLGWAGTGNGSYSGADNPASITVDGPINETAVWGHEFYLTVVSSKGLPSPASGWLEAGISINASVSSPVPESVGTRYVCTGWTGTGSVSASGTSIPVTFTIDTSSNIVWNWKIQYLLTVHTDPTGISPRPNISLEGPWYDNGTHVNCAAQKISGRIFDHWTVDGTRWDPGVNNITITMDGPHEVIAHYVRASTWWENLLRPEILQVILGVAGIMITVAFVGTAWFRTRRRRGVIKALLEEIDEAYSKLKMNPRECKEELCRLRDTILEDLADGKITKEDYDIINRKIEKHIDLLGKKGVDEDKV